MLPSSGRARQVSGSSRTGGVGEGGVPAGEGDVVVLLVVGVPAQHHVAEPQALVQRREELGAVDVLAAQDAVVVEHADLDVRQPPLLDDRPGLRGGAHLVWLHAENSFSGGAGGAGPVGLSDVSATRC